VTVALLYLVADALPRGVGVLAPRLARAAAPLARRSLLPFRPLLGLIAAIERGLTVVVPPGRKSSEGPRTEERDILAGVLSLRDGTVEEVMTPRLDIVAGDSTAGWREVVELVRRGEHARIPVYRDDLDDIVGVLHVKDLTPAVSGVEEPPAEWHELVRPAQYVPESKSLASQLRAFQRGPTHLAIVVDEFGGTSGIVTLEDVLEEVVGEIHGEYDVDEEPEIEHEGEDRFWVDGAVNVDQLASLLGIEIEREGVSTVGGFIYSELGRVPRPGEEFRLGEFRIVVERVVRRRVRRVYFERQQNRDATAARLEDAE
jgi:CBS domain containing-hemolysin-like protein